MTMRNSNSVASKRSPASPRSMIGKTCTDCSPVWTRQGNIRAIQLCALHASAPKLVKAVRELLGHFENAYMTDPETTKLFKSNVEKWKELIKPSSPSTA